jgi:hypothetical protein
MHILLNRDDSTEKVNKNLKKKIKEQLCLTFHANNDLVNGENCISLLVSLNVTRLANVMYTPFQWLLNESLKKAVPLQLQIYVLILKFFNTTQIHS